MAPTQEKTMTYPRLGQENLICAYNWHRCEAHQDKSWYTRACSSDPQLIDNLNSLANGYYTAYICDSFQHPQAIETMEQKAFTLIYLNCGHTQTDTHTNNYPR